ncbi:hypothetical protein MJO29_012047 [Puccinia striiformis f. sp. tritici]|nr:hypothetical protein Pst134EB_023595 [Puccinia striiformis f. sp. tritici]KAI7945659.1 hypothetical protein MJO29_012047 [Puccinia striiformis f. sp. tritici]
MGVSQQPPLDHQNRTPHRPSARSLQQTVLNIIANSAVSNILAEKEGRVSDRNNKQIYEKRQDSNLYRHPAGGHVIIAGGCGVLVNFKNQSHTQSQSHSHEHCNTQLPTFSLHRHPA